MPSVLLVDDNATSRAMLSHRLQRRGFDVHEAMTGMQAVEAADRLRPDVVLMDLALPELDGIEATRRLRAQSSTAQLPIIVLTTAALVSDREEALAAGCTDVDTKPVDVPRLIEKIEYCLGGAKVLGTTTTGAFDWNLETDRVFYTARWAALLGLDPERLLPRFSEWMSRIHVDEQARVAQELRAHIDGLTPAWESEHRIRHADGQYRWMMTRGTSQRSADGRPVRLAGAMSDVTFAKGTDPLTGLPNRLLFLERMHSALVAPRVDGRPRFAVLVMDLDGFRFVNDSLGHAAGDELLVRVAQRLGGSVRRTDYAGHLSSRRTLSRLGGDAFALLLEDIHDEATARGVADRVQALLQEPFVLDGRPVHCTLSIGVALDAARYVSGEELVRDADLAAYRAGKRGRGQTEVFTEAALAPGTRRLKLQGDLRDGLDRNEVVPYYQPIVALAGGAIEGVEALARWRHPELGLLGPDTLVPVAEDAGLLGPLTYTVFTRAAGHLREWRATCPGAGRLTMSVNIAPRLFSDVSLVERLCAIVAAHGLAPADFTLEILERTLLDAAPPVVARLHALRGAGFALALDDFGTGADSLDHLHAFALTTLKVDRTLVNRMSEVSDAAVQQVRRLVTLAHALGIDVTAEGIETQAQVRWLQSMACARGQGFFFERAVAPESMGQLLATPHFQVPVVIAADRPPLSM